MKRNSQGRTTAYFVFAVVAALALINGTNAPLLAAMRGLGQAALLPVQSLTAGVTDRVGASVSALSQMGTLASENQRLQGRLDDLQRQLDQMTLAVAENSELRNALAFKRLNDFQLTAAQVIGRDPEGLIRVIEIDRGSRAGIRPGMVVVAGGGLVGRVSEAGPGTARVQLITDADARVNAVIPTGQINGTVRGLGQALDQFDISPAMGASAAAEMPKVGDQLLTSGLGGTYPRGLAVGSVVSFHRVDYALTQSAVIKPAVDLSRVRVVLVIMDFAPLR